MHKCQLWLSLGVSAWVESLRQRGDKLIRNVSRQMLCCSTARLQQDLDVDNMINDQVIP